MYHNKIIKFMNISIAIVSPSYPPFSSGGISSAHYNLGRALQYAGYDVAFFTYEDTTCDATDPQNLIRRGLPHWCARICSLICRLFFSYMDKGKLSYQTNDILRAQWGAWRLRHSLKKFSPDIIIFPDHGCPALSICKIAGAKSIVISHHNPARFNSPLLFEHAVSLKDIIYAVALENFSLRHVDMILCPTEYMVCEVKKTYKFNGSIHVAHNIISEESFANVVSRSVTSQLGMLESCPVVYIPDAGSSVKGERYIFEIVRRIAISNPNVLFLLTGNIGPVLNYELSLNNELKKRIYMPGRLSYLENLSYISSCALCVSPTLAENFGMALIEASYFGMPIVTFNTGGNAEVVEQGKTGEVVPYLDIDTLVEKAIWLLSPEQTERRLRMGEAAKEKARSLIHSGLQQYESAICRLLEKKSLCSHP